MKFFTKSALLLWATLVCLSVTEVFGQSNVLNPDDPIVVYNPAAPPATPAYGTLAKWVKTNRVGFNTTSFKAYYYKGMAFRVKFPKTYQHGVADGKKYPILVFFHGRGEKGTIYDNEYQLYHGGQTHMNAVENGKFDGFLLYPQSTNADGFFSSGHYDIIKELIEDYFVPNVKVDINRVLVDGLSGGGNATWSFTMKYPLLVAGATPISSPIGSTSPLNNLNVLKFTPIWQFQGGLDESPSPQNTQLIVNAYQNAGANYYYSLYPTLGHSCWNKAWSEPDYFPFQTRAHKANPYPLTGRTEFCPGDAINVTIGVTPGFTAYQWKKDGQLITGAGSNQITATSTGIYECRIQRGTVWSEWSPVPVEIKIKAPTVTPPVAAAPLSSKVIPAPDGNTGVWLKLPTGYESYVWQKQGNNTVLGTDSSYYATTPGLYVAKVTELYGCSSAFSEAFEVVDANGGNKPEAATNIIVTTLSKTSQQIAWSNHAAPTYDETGFEIYKSNAASGPFVLAAIADANVVSVTLNDLNAGTTYFYKVRAVNQFSAAPLSDIVSGTTYSDTLAPTAPGNLRITSKTKSSVSLIWNASSDDVEVTRYEIFSNGVKVANTTDTSFTIYNLAYNNYYKIVVKAKDFTGNTSPGSNQVTAHTAQTGYNYKYYTGNWTVLPDFNTLTPVATGNVPVINLNNRTQDNYFGFLWEGFINVPADGNYTFRTNSDDGSKLYIGALNQKTSAYDFNATAVVDNDGIHGGQNREGTVYLTAGNYPIAVAYFNVTSGRSISVTCRTPLSGTSYPAIPEAWLYELPDTANKVAAMPSDLKATVRSNKSIQLTWAYGTGNVTGFEIYRSENPYASFELIKSVSSDKRSFADTSLQANTKYYYKIKAVNQFGESDLSYIYPEAEWRFNNSFLDASENARLLTPVSNPSIDNTEKREGGQSVFMNGTNHYFNINTADGYLKNAYDEKTIAFWMKSMNNTGNRVLFDIGGSDDGISVRLDSNRLYVGVASNNVRRNFYIPYSTDSWNHVAVVYNKSRLTLYLNGEEAGNIAALNFNTLGVTTNGSRIGLNDGSNAFNSGSARFHGWLDHFSIFASALAPEDVQLHMTNGLSASHATTLSAPLSMSAPQDVNASAVSVSSIKVNWAHQVVVTDSAVVPAVLIRVEAEDYQAQTGIGTETCSEGGRNVKSIDPNDWMEYVVAIPRSGTYQLTLRVSCTTNDSAQAQLRLLDGTVLNTLTLPRTTGWQVYTSVTAPVQLEAGVQTVRIFAQKKGWNFNWFELSADSASIVNSQEIHPDFFEVYRSDSEAGAYEKIASVTADNFTYLDTLLPSNTTYYYQVKAGSQAAISELSVADSARTGNNVPVLNAVPTTNIRYGTERSVEIAATDADAEVLNFTFNGLPSFVAFNKTADDKGTLVCAPASENVGTYSFTVFVEDQNGGKDSLDITLFVNDNFNPTIAGENTLILNEMQTGAITLKATDQNESDSLVWTLDGVPSYASVANMGDSIVISFAPGYADKGTYQIKALVTDGKDGVDSMNVEVLVKDVNPSKTIYVNFSDGVYTVPGNWNNTAKAPTANSLFNNLVDSSGSNTGISLQLVNAWTGINNQGMNTGSNTGLYPDAALISSYYTSVVQTVRLGSLAPGKYNLRFLGSRANPMSGVGVTSLYTSGSQSVTLNAANNAQNGVSLNSLQPLADGSLQFTVQKAPGSTFGYLNVLEIQTIYDDSSAPAKPRNLAAVLNTEGIALSWIDAAYNENSYAIYRSTERDGAYMPLTLNGNARDLETYQDNQLTGGTTYYYTVMVSNDYGFSYSDTISAATANLAPLLDSISGASMKTGETKIVSVSATDTPGDSITLSATGLPEFASFTDNGSGSGQVVFTPGQTTGTFGPITVSASDASNAVSSRQFYLTITSAGVTTAYLNFNQTEPAPAPWNNMNSAPNAGVSIQNILDESNAPTGINVTVLDKWTASSTLGTVTGDNSGKYPDVVAKTFYYESSGNTKRIRLSGLLQNKRYNLVFFASRAGYGGSLTTRYSVGTQSVDLDANDNTMNTVSISGLAPDANGEITVNMARLVGPVAYIGAMEIQTVDFEGKPLAPVPTAVAMGRDKIRVQWTVNGSVPAIYKVFRSSSSTGEYALLSELPGNVLSYTDSSLSAGSAYYYKLQSVQDTLESDLSVAASARTMVFNVNINFNDGTSAAPAQLAWNNTNALIGAGFTMNNMVSDESQNTGIGLTVANNFSGFNTLGATTGNNTGVVPDNVMKSFYYLNFGDTAKLLVTGLNQSQIYNFVFFGSRGNPNVGVNVTSGYKIGNQVVYLDGGNNTMNTAQIGNVKADANGEVLVSIFASAQGGFGYLNSMAIQGTEDDDAPVEVMARAAQTAISANGAAVVTTLEDDKKIPFVYEFKAYPNPFVQDLVLSVDLPEVVGKMRVSLTDMSGRIVFVKEFSNLGAGFWQKQLGLPGDRLSKGIYFLRVDVPDGPPVIMKMIK